MKKSMGLVLMVFSMGTMLMAQTKTFYMNSVKVDCSGVGAMKCMQYKHNPSENWKLLYSPIEGFNYEEGFLYTLEVKTIKVRNPPADGSSLRYVLKKIISKQKDKKLEAETQRSVAGKWIISSINVDGQMEDVSGKAWEMEFRISENAVGVGICNRMGGGYTIDGEKIKFGAMRSTKMICPDIKYESAFGKAISEVDNYSFDRNKMMLRKGNEILIVLYMPV